MNLKEFSQEISIIILAAVILGLSVSFLNSEILLPATISFLVIISLNILAKKLLAYYLEADIKPKFWCMYQYWFTKRSHFKKPIPMLWLPLVLSLIFRGALGLFGWFGILEFDVKPKIERVSRRHGLYRFSQMTDWHISLIAAFGIIVNLIAAIIGYILGFETFTTLSIYFAVWSILPIASLDGSKILFGSKVLWLTLFIIISIFLGYSLVVI